MYTMWYWTCAHVLITSLAISNGDSTGKLIKSLIATVASLEKKGDALQQQVVEQKEAFTRLEQMLQSEINLNKQLTVELETLKTDVELGKELNANLQYQINHMEQTLGRHTILSNAQEYSLHSGGHNLQGDEVKTMMNVSKEDDNDGNMRETNSSDQRIRSERFVVNSGQTVAFHALLSGYEHANIGLHQHIAFEDVQLNLGAAYHAQSGVFIAPLDGVYMFSTTLLTSKFSTHPSLIAWLMKNGVVIGKIWAYGSNTWHDSSSLTAIAQLKVGDQVWVEMGLDIGSIWGGMYTAFSGSLLSNV